MEVIALVHRPEWWLLVVGIPVGGVALLVLAAYSVKKKLGRRKE